MKVDTKFDRNFISFDVHYNVVNVIVTDAGLYVENGILCPFRGRFFCRILFGGGGEAVTLDVFNDVRLRL